MITRQEIEGNWNQVKGRVQERWGQLTENELTEARGSADQLVGVIQEKTGESRRAIEDFLEHVIEEGGSVVEQVVGTARTYANQARENYRDQYDHVSEAVHAGYQQAESMVQRNPVESVAVAFGAGIISGVVLGLVLKSR